MIKSLPEIKNLLIVYNQPDKKLNQEEQLTEADTVDEVNQVKKTLDSAGINSSIFGLTENNIGKFLSLKADFIFNLCYGIGSLPDSENEVYKIFDKLRIPYTGGPGEAIALTNNKSQTKKLLQKNGIPTPGFKTIISSSDLGTVNLDYPLMVKTRDLGCSLGMDQKSVAANYVELKSKVSELLAKYKSPVLVEEYIDGREFSVFILGNGKSLKIFPPVEIVFGKVFDTTKHWKIFDFDAKWNQNSVYCKETPYVSPVKIDKKLEFKIKEICTTAYRLSNCNDYARLDLRIDQQNNPYILEINLNPSIGHGSQIDTGIKAAGWNFDKLILEIIAVCFKRFNGK